ncbi:5'-methylthioadenosine/adenosylhomocysteine nucleosidase [Isachenkonia alkalipeptolytica]|uniref:adenosylhomocysteine nucleosidase n=1 Tax=Isachenkonia alkalipeptolytica TaxID=2565777 RepID=A0AA44BFM4_9CLOT|nr:5'-methylthioadenosine/adenosylhomocysteine nucleosidase [Isachenkonia alkalipeptolytica]NBG89145.1 5'-methylthioadenosine/adenosylhomocysteine nucleosidase [Isachenkonia alkalipeptolytica]
MIQYGIIGAMDEEVDILQEEMEVHLEKEIAGLHFYQGVLEKKSVVLVRSGIGKVNAAVCTQILISEFKVEKIINTGVAGALGEDLEILDIVVSTELQQYDVDASKFGYKTGEIPRMDTSIFSAEPALVKKAYEKGLRRFGEKGIKKGKIVSGDTFVSSVEMKHRLEKEFKARCTEMEGASIAQACYMNRVPFVVIRTMSDKADGSANDNYKTFVTKAAFRSKELVKDIIREENF